MLVLITKKLQKDLMQMIFCAPALIEIFVLFVSKRMLFGISIFVNVLDRMSHSCTMTTVLRMESECHGDKP